MSKVSNYIKNTSDFNRDLGFLNMDDIAGIIVLVGTFIFAILLVCFGFKLLTTRTEQETTIIELGDFKLSLSTMVGGFLILGGVFTIYKLLDGFY